MALETNMNKHAVHAQCGVLPVQTSDLKKQKEYGARQSLPLVSQDNRCTVEGEWCAKFYRVSLVARGIACGVDHN